MLCDRLERLFLTADRARFQRSNGDIVPKFVYLDMEEYRDKSLTAERSRGAPCPPSTGLGSRGWSGRGGAPESSHRRKRCAGTIEVEA